MRAAWSENGIRSPRREPPEPEAVSRVFGSWFARQGYPRIRFYDLWHTHITLMIKTGVHTIYDDAVQCPCGKCDGNDFGWYD